MILYRRVFCMILVASSFTGAIAAEKNQNSVEEIASVKQNRNSPLRRENNPQLFDSIKSAALRWREAVLSKDVDKLVVFATPDYKENVKLQLRKKESVLNRFFFGDDRSAFALFRDSKTSGYSFIVDRDPKRPLSRPDGITVCFYDGSKLNPVADKDILNLLPNPDGLAVLCIYFSGYEDQWYSNFEFGPED